MSGEGQSAALGPSRPATPSGDLLVAIARAGIWPLIACLGAIPLVVTCPAPLMDWPNHMAGFHVLTALLAGDAFWERFYSFNTFFVPAAAVDLGFAGLTWLGADPALAARLVLLATYAAFVGGFCALARALAAYDRTKIAMAMLLFYGHALFWGLVNYVFGLGLMMALLAAWLALRRFPAARLAVAGAGALLLLLAHAVPAVVFALLLACFDATDLSRRRASLRDCAAAPLALGLILPALMLAPGGALDDHAMSYSGEPRLTEMALWKLDRFGTILLGGGWAQDAATIAAVLGSALALAWSARASIAAGPALATGALLGLVLVAPERIGTGSLLDARLAIVPVLLAAAAVRLKWRSERARRLCLAAMILLVAVRTGVITLEWRRAGAVFADFEQAASVLPPRGIVMLANGRPVPSLSWQEIWSPPIQSMAAQVVAHGLFYPHLFANPAQQPIALHPQLLPLVQPWDLSDDAHFDASAASLAAICATGTYTGVFLTVLYTSPFAIARAAPATLHAQDDFLIVDACRLSPR